MTSPWITSEMKKTIQTHIDKVTKNTNILYSWEKDSARIMSLEAQLKASRTHGFDSNAILSFGS